MAKYVNEQQMIQNHEILFQNLTTNEEIQRVLTEYGYDDTEIREGKEILQKASELYHKSIREDQKELELYTKFKEEQSKLDTVYAEDRKKTRIVYKDKADVLKNLRMVGRGSRAIASVLEDITVFYNTLLLDEELRQPLERLKLTQESINQQIAQLNKVKEAYGAYTNQKGIKQQATKDKNKGLQELEKWSKQLYSIARIALAQKPQLLESLAKLVRS